MNSNRLFAILMATTMSATVFAETETESNTKAVEQTEASKLNMDNGVIPIADDRGFTLQSNDGNFVFKPYLFMQTTANFRYYDDEGLWIDYAVCPELRFRAGKFKTPFTHAYLTTLGETLFPSLPTSLTAVAILPYSLNAVTPGIGTGFDLGVEIHGFVANKFGYQVGLWNGTGSAQNGATKTISDDLHIPSLLYAGRLTFQPKGAMPMTQGNPKLLHEDKMLIGLSANYNVESENESTNDFRAGVEFAMLKNRWYVGAEAYYMHIGFTKRQKVDESFNYWGGYAQVGYFVHPRWQLGFRYDFYDRNGSSKDGFLNMPAATVNFFIPKTNIKLSAMYQYIGRTGHETQLDRDIDDLGICTQTAQVMLQYAF